LLLRRVQFSPKRKTVVQKQLDKQRIEAKAAAALSKQRKAARVAQLVVPAPDSQGYERQLKKVATKGGGCSLLPHAVALEIASKRYWPLIHHSVFASPTQLLLS